MTSFEETGLPAHEFGTWLAQETRRKQEELSALGSDLTGHADVSAHLRRGQVGIDQGMSRQTRAGIVADINHFDKRGSEVENINSGPAPKRVFASEIQDHPDRYVSPTVRWQRGEY